MIQVNCIVTGEENANSLIAMHADTEVEVKITTSLREEEITMTWKEASVVKDLIILAENNV